MQACRKDTERHITESACVHFLKGMRQISSHHAMCSGLCQGHEAGQRVEGCQALVPCRNGAAPTLLKMKEEAEATYVVERWRGTKV